MREILFRGKDVNSSEWRIGYFYTAVQGCVAIIGDGADGYQVKWNSVGQYTGLTDKNGVKIFEGDILKIRRVSDHFGTYFFPPVEYPANVIVKWDLCSWLWEVIGDKKFYISFPDAWCHYECEVIGNIYDDPEMLTQ